MIDDRISISSGSPDKRRTLVVGSLVAGLGLLIASPILYWRVVNTIPAATAMLPEPPRKNGYDTATRITHWVETHTEIPGIEEKLRPADLRTLERTLHPHVDELRTAFRLPWMAASLRVSASEVEFGGRSDPGRLADLFIWESRAAAAQGNHARALSCCFDAIELGSLLCRRGGVEHRYHGQDAAFAGIDELETRYSTLPLAGLAGQLARVRRIRKSWPAIAETLDVQRVLALSRCRGFLLSMADMSWQEQLDSLSGRSALWSSSRGPRSGWSAWQQLMTPKGTALAEIEHYYHQLGAASSQPAPQGVPVPPVSNPWAEPFCDSSFTGRYRGEWPRNNLALLEVALAVRLHRLQRGREPQSLADISPQWLPEVPVDVWGQVIAYRVHRGNPVIYSLGCDGIDEGGRAVNPSTLISGGKGDLVFGRLSRRWWRNRPAVSQ